VQKWARPGRTQDRVAANVSRRYLQHPNLFAGYDGICGSGVAGGHKDRRIEGRGMGFRFIFRSALLDPLRLGRAVLFEKSAPSDVGGYDSSVKSPARSLATPWPASAPRAAGLVDWKAEEFLRLN